ncbi:PREDICTED: keratin, type II cytoskeletal 5-like isoform X2 [Lupinus angustifolius]|uniref:keratin, type II cytoskeletal 5-like isoform X2 n=1 Tax=Lupinus angustifolius TaxID=3871 RepID=UPI00092F0696|nr:PREDICTED: keratin, type II cytoskeletal 5-like isoform X2 [Lupinus angustifolius]
MSGNNGSDTVENKGFLWKLPELNSEGFGKMGPAFGLGAGCGIGIGIGLLGGVGFGPGIPGFQVGVGFGAGCGVGLGFGYGVGKGIAQDVNRRDDITALVDELVDNTKNLIAVTSREIDKWRR